MADPLSGLLSPLPVTFASHVQIGRNQWEESLRSEEALAGWNAPLG